jgi:hypothetical protein
MTKTSPPFFPGLGIAFIPIRTNFLRDSIPNSCMPLSWHLYNLLFVNPGVTKFNLPPRVREGGSLYSSPTDREGTLATYLEGGLFVAVGWYGTILTSPGWPIWMRQTSPTSERLWSVAYGNGLFVAVGNNGTILTSPDGVNWTAQTSGTEHSLHGVTYGNGLFVAVGHGGAILTSPDGVNWTAQISPTSENLWSVAYGNGLFVAVGNNGTILTSP